MRLLSGILTLVLLSAAAPVAAADTFTYSYENYTAELPLHPKRVFVLDSRTGLDFAASAGFPIIATDWDDGDNSYLADRADRLLAKYDDADAREKAAQ
jgi:iron complex transport system substrate-binding protein